MVETDVKNQICGIKLLLEVSEKLFRVEVLVNGATRAVGACHTQAAIDAYPMKENKTCSNTQP